MTMFRDLSPRQERTTETGDRSPVWWRQRRIAGTAAAVVMAAIVFLVWRGCHNSATGGGEPAIVVSVQATRAGRGTIANEITVVATLAAQREATISPKIAAQIARMPLLTNRRMRAGEVIAVLESRDLTAQRAEAAAALQEAETAAHQTTHGRVPLTNAQDQKSVIDARAALENARKTYQRRQVLFQQGGISSKDLEASKLAATNAENDLQLAEASTTVHRGVTNPGDVRMAESKVVQARQRLENLDAQLSYTVIRAPFDGTITAQFQYQGDLANPAGKLVTIADGSNLIAKTQIAEEVASTLKPGDAVRILPDDLQGQSYSGTISLVGHAADPQSRGVEVWVRVPNPAGHLRPNGIARAIIDAQPVSNAVIVPSAAVTLDATNGNSGTVMVVDRQSVAHEVHVTIGIRANGRTQITSGLGGGETVVTEGNYGLPDGTKVTMARPAATGSGRQ